MLTQHVFLIGYMGCGKSYWGRQLAKSLNYDFIDLDDLIVEREDASILEIFEQFGEASFRKREHEALLSLRDIKNPTVVSTGGGAPCFHQNLSVMNQLGETLFLEASPQTLKQNILRSDDERPIVKKIPENELEEYISNHLKERISFYEQSKLKVSVDDLKLEYLTKLFL